MVVIIPAYNPDYHLLDVLKDLKKVLNNKIVIVNDGSDNTNEINKVFEEAKKYGILINHEVNRGKGAAMKTAMKYVIENYDEDGVIFVDADNQHKAHDTLKMIECFNENKNSLILGVRVFDKNVPIRSEVGNKITRWVFKSYTGTYISDTQTGLRCINTKYIPLLLKIDGDRFEYEMNMLVEFTKNKIDIVELPIDTIYEDKKNSTSHFNVFKDSFLIYKVFFKFILSIISTLFIDCLLFLILLSLGKGIIISNVISKSISYAYFYIMNKDRNISLFKYIISVIIMLIISSSILYLFSATPLSKIIIEIVLFVFSFNLQNKYILRR